MILYNFFLDYFVVLKLFPGDPILDPPISGTIRKNATEVSLLGGRGLVFFNRWKGLLVSLNLIGRWR